MLIFYRYSVFIAFYFFAFGKGAATRAGTSTAAATNRANVPVTR